MTHVISAPVLRVKAHRIDFDRLAEALEPVASRSPAVAFHAGRDPHATVCFTELTCGELAAVSDRILDALPKSQHVGASVQLIEQTVVPRRRNVGDLVASLGVFLVSWGAS